MRWLMVLHNRTTLFTKVLLANAMIVLTGTLVVVYLQRSLLMAGGSSTGQVEIALISVGLAVTFGINWAILRLAFRPLFSLQATLERVRQGDWSARVPDVEGDPDIAKVTATANEMLDRLEQYRQDMARVMLKGMEEERKRLARELHDETCQSLTSVIVNLEAVCQQMPEDSPTTQRLKMTQEVARATLDDTRRFMFDLRPSVLDDLGLVPAIRWYISQRVLPEGIAAEFQSTGLEDRLAEELETALFRIIQESITNAIKHGRARRIQISLARQGDQVKAVVRDDGSGFDLARLHRGELHSGMGLYGMYERARLVGGSIQIDSAPGRGTTMRATVPVRMRGA
jgi:two-component system sensor histidine kinase UhpB